MQTAFTYTALPARVIFERGAIAQVAAEVKRLGCNHALVLCTPEQRDLAERVAGLLGPRCVGIFDQAAMHVPMDTVRTVREQAEAQTADCAVAVGGGSTIGLGKAIALESSLPIVAVPSTYAGSEMTPIYGITDHGEKTTGRDPRVLPRTVLYDVDLTLTLPVELSMTSGLNAIAHAAEGLYAPDANPVMGMMAEEGIRALAEGLPAVHSDTHDIAARLRCQYGAWLCATVLGHVGMGLHHKLCHTLGGSFELPHAPTHSIVLPHALAYNRAAAPQAMQVIARALGSSDAPQGIYDLAVSLDVHMALRDLDMPEQGITRAAELASKAQYPNPRPLEAGALATLLHNAWAGKPPAEPGNPAA
ncbi:maleylacetate reductase [Salinisphaera sp.]|uniref:maleylacetate reductase n=1 Tax=Salinisphaera sp. TaxID=1914330 RepID=UPI0032C22E14